MEQQNVLVHILHCYFYLNFIFIPSRLSSPSLSLILDPHPAINLSGFPPVHAPTHPLPYLILVIIPLSLLTPPHRHSKPRHPPTSRPPILRPFGSCQRPRNRQFKTTPLWKSFSRFETLFFTFLIFFAHLSHVSLHRSKKKSRDKNRVKEEIEDPTLWRQWS